jgi:hypothetical protein
MSTAKKRMKKKLAIINLMSYFCSIISHLFLNGMIVDLESFLADIAQLNIDGRIILMSGILFLATTVCTVITWTLDIIRGFSSDGENIKYHYY